MPEIGEIARIVHYLRKHLQGRQISRVHYPSEDPKIFQTAKTGLTTASFAAALQGKRVVDVGQQGKYFWLVMDSPPHPLMHFGMTGWIKFRHDETAYYKPMKEKKREEKDATQERLQNGQRGMDAVKSGEKDDTLAQSITSGGEDWPPRFWKFMIETDDKPDAIDAAFIDARRFGRVFAVDAPASAIRNTSPLKENGPDPIVDTQVFTRSWFVARLSTKHVPIKALLLDQSVISGIGNWVADETLYQAAVHPEQYCDTFSDEQAGRLYDSVVEVCSIACETLADSDQFPESWLMRHRWNKGRSDSNRLPNGEKISHITVGGRTSAIVPSRQKKAIVSASNAVEQHSDEDRGQNKAGKRKSTKGTGEPQGDGSKTQKRRKTASTPRKQEPGTKDSGDALMKKSNSRKNEPQAQAKEKTDASTTRKSSSIASQHEPRRRSARNVKA